MMHAVDSISVLDPVFSFADEECCDREPTGLLAVKAALASHALRFLSRRDAECSWEQLRCEVEAESGILNRFNGEPRNEGPWVQLKSEIQFGSSMRKSGKARSEGLQAQVKSKIECALAMHKGDCNEDAIVALEAALMADAPANHISRHVTPTEKRGMEAQTLSLRMQACAEEVLAQMRVSQARHELADYLDMVSSLDDSRLDKQKSWFLDTAKACDLKHGVLKEYVNEVFAADGRLMQDGFGFVCT